MDLNTLIRDIHRLNHELERFERKYGVMSATFYEAYSAGEEPEDDAWVLDFEKWQDCMRSGLTDSVPIARR